MVNKPSMISTAPAALGARVHSGWAVLVAVADTPDGPVVIARRRVTLADPSIAGSKQPYHAAQDWPLPKAEKYLSQCITRTKGLAREAISSLIADLRKQGHTAASCGVLTASQQARPGLAATLASHPLLHTAESALFREAVAEAAEHCGLAVANVPERELDERTATGLGTTQQRLDAWLVEMGRELGPPWTQDQKRAALVGWMLLRAARRSQTAGGQDAGRRRF